VTSCDETRLSRYLDGELDLWQQNELERHLASCRQCRNELAELRSINLLLSELGSSFVPVPPMSDRRVAGAIERRRRLAPFVALSRMTPAAVGSCIAAVLVFMTFNLGNLHQNRLTSSSGSQAVTTQTIVQRQSVPLLTARRGSAIAGARVVPSQAQALHSMHRSSTFIVN
jgi:anti-sigma factor RsiW